MAHQFTSHQANRFINGVIDIERRSRGVGFGHERTYSPDYLARTIAIFEDPLHGTACFGQVWCFALEPAQAGLGVRDDAGKRLVYLVRNGGGQFSQRRNARDVSEFGLRFSVSPLALS